MFDFLKPKSPLEKAAKDLREPYAQPDVRQAAMDKLFELGTEEAYDELLNRFTFNANGQIADESEKKSLVDRLASSGEDATPAIERFIKNQKSITFPIQALRKIRGDEGARTFIVETLSELEPQDHRSIQAKVVLVGVMAEIGSADDAELLVRYLEDHSDDVQFQAIEALEHLQAESAAPALVDVCCSDLHAPRIQRRAARALAERGWSVKGRFDAFHPELAQEWKLNKSGALEKI